MTTAIEIDNKGESILNASFVPAGPFGHGAGHVRPSRAMNPGLVYDLGLEQYLDFLCGLKYNATVLAMFNGMPYKCPAKVPKLEDLNYPSITVVNITAAGAMVKHTVKNVEFPGIYKALVRQPTGLNVTVSPAALQFAKLWEEKTFEVKFEVKNAKLAKHYSFGALASTNGKQFVKSPIVVQTAA